MCVHYWAGLWKDVYRHSRERFGSANAPVSPVPTALDGFSSGFSPDPVPLCRFRKRGGLCDEGSTFRSHCDGRIRASSLHSSLGGRSLTADALSVVWRSSVVNGGSCFWTRTESRTPPMCRCRSLHPWAITKASKSTSPSSFCGSGRSCFLAVEASWANMVVDRWGKTGRPSMLPPRKLPLATEAETS